MFCTPLDRAADQVMGSLPHTQPPTTAVTCFGLMQLRPAQATSAGPPGCATPQPSGHCGPLTTTNCKGLSFHGSPIMRSSPQLVPIFYGNWTDMQRNIVFKFLSGIGGSCWMGITALYSDSDGWYQNTRNLFNLTADKAYAGVSIGTWGLTGILQYDDVSGQRRGACGLGLLSSTHCTGHHTGQSVSVDGNLFVATYCNCENKQGARIYCECISQEASTAMTRTRCLSVPLSCCAWSTGSQHSV